MERMSRNILKEPCNVVPRHLNPTRSKSFPSSLYGKLGHITIRTTPPTLNQRREKSASRRTVLTCRQLLYQVSGPVVIADGMGGAAMYELVRVGHDNLIGEIIRLEGDSATIQVYEETAGLMVNDPVLRTHKPLSVELGALGLLGNTNLTYPLLSHASWGQIFPLLTKIPLLERIRAYRKQRMITITPPLSLGEGDLITGGDLYATVFENSLVEHRIALPPDAMGKVTYVAPAGHYSLKLDIAPDQCTLVSTNESIGH
ncbi:V-type proton ATPase catalytic subunit A [Tanacetum coccineum]|uniref:V-type proton ATPase catalytic subunit A n=1 Tax=Tanacetum coccineum TaxID=301880 RepID=A0ABQ5ADR3_9ASTR